MTKTIVIAFATLLISAPALSNDAGTSEPLMRIWKTLNENLGKKLDEWSDEDRAEAIKHARIVPRGAQPEIIIRRSGVNEYGNPDFEKGFSFNGKFLIPGDTLRTAFEVFGPGHQKNRQGDYEWKDLGIYVRSSWRANTVLDALSREEDKTIDGIYITLNAWGEPILPRKNRRTSTFNGYLELDNVGVDAQTTIRDIRALASREGLEGAHEYIYCMKERAICEVGRLSGNKGIEIGFDFDEDKCGERRIYTIGLRFST